MPGVISEDEVVWSDVLERWPHTIRSLGDAILAAAAGRSSLDAVATFDQGLARQLTRQGSVLYW
jgi:predicted nucleic acid-binding protein